MPDAFDLVGSIHLSQQWVEGGVCLVCSTGQTLAVAPVAQEILAFVMAHSAARRQDLLQYLDNKFDAASDELESALDLSLAELERLGIIRRVTLDS